MSVVTVQFMAALAEVSKEAHLFVPYEEILDTQTFLKERFNLISQYLKIHGVEQKRLLGRASVLYFMKALKQVKRLADDDKINVVITRNTTLLPYLSKLTRLPNMITVFESHGYHGRQTLPNLPPRRKPKLLSLDGQQRFIEKLYINKLSGMICIANPQMQLYKQDGVKIPMIWLPLGGYTQPPVLDSDSLFSKQTIAYIGRFNKNINVPLIVQALNNCDQPIRFIWIGLNAENKDKVRLLLSDLKDIHQAETYEWMAHADMQQFLLNEVSVGLVSYKMTHRSATVISPTKVFDYFGLGIPVVGPKIPTIEGLIIHNHNGLLYDGHLESDLAEKIKQILTDKDLFVKLRQGAIDSGQHHTWQNRAEKLVQFVGDHLIEKQS